MNKAAPLLCIGIGAYWAYMGLTKYKLWVSNGPGGGLFPLAAGIVLIVCSVMLLIRYSKQDDSPTIPGKALLLIGVTIATVLSANIIGMVPALGVFIILWLKFYENKSIKLSLSLGLGTALFLYVLFDVLLNVPLPMGIFFK